MRILHLEDSPPDAELVRYMLEEEWPGCAIQVVDKQSAYLEALRSKPDLILSDFTLGGFDGLQALKLAQAVAPEVPFIFVSGSIGEERAVEAVRYGAYDYVNKDRILRLNPAVRRALGERSETLRREAAEDESRRAHERLRELADYIDRCREAITVADLNRRYIFWNRGAAEMTGWTAAEAIGKTSREFNALFERNVDPYPLVLAAGEWRGELAFVTKDGRNIVIDEHIMLMRDDAGAPKAFLRISSDITERKRIEEQLLRTQRIETIGMLAAGIAHDLNNVFAPINLAVPVLQMGITDPTQLTLLTAIEKSAQRGTEMVRQVVGFARGSAGERRRIELGPIIRDLALVLRQSFPPAILHEQDIEEGLWPIEAHATQIHQVLLNLCVNARDALPQGGRLTVRAGNRARNETRFVRLEVSDTGTGIAPQVLEHIWKPFFSTKGPAQGTGLGLSTVRGIVEDHGGTIEVRSEVGKGTTFEILLPAARG
jgi:two-component system cell cycle sensor histidine kinase/response regulator CckA